MTPYDVVRHHYTFPFELYGWQQEEVNMLAPEPRSALYWEPGLGKTAGSTHCALFHMIRGDADQTIVLLPPILIVGWSRWLAKVKKADGSPLKVTLYRGSPAQRRDIKLDGDFVLMSIQIFKKDYERLWETFYNKRVHVICDEAHCLKDVGTANYKNWRDFTEPHTKQILTGTPLNNPLDAYAYVKIVAPNVYRNLNQFTMIHVAKVDFFKKPIEFQNLDLLKQNMSVNASRKTKEDVLDDLPECIIVPLEYDLDPKHLKLYRQLVNQQLLTLPDGDKIDATQVTALYHALGQIVMNWDHFGGDESLVAAGFDVLDEVLDELGGRKLVVFSNYQRTNRSLVAKYGCPAVYGEVSAVQKQKNIDKFVDDPDCKLIVMQPTSGGVGVDGLQHVCQDALYLEPPITPSHFTQSLSRVHREGQRNVVTVRIATALNTIQQHLVKQLTAKEALVNPLQNSKALLQAALFGE